VFPHWKRETGRKRLTETAMAATAIPPSKAHTLAGNRWSWRACRAGVEMWTVASLVASATRAPIASGRSRPPKRPALGRTFAGFERSSSLSPVAIRFTFTAALITSAGRFSPLGLGALLCPFFLG
jgi:hypothetical protein